MTASTSAATTTVSLRDPGQLLAAIPHLLGFHPVDSVLVIAHGGETGRRVGNVVRADLPSSGSADAVTGLAHQLREPLLRDDSTAATVAVVGGAPEEQGTGPPHRPLVATIRQVFTGAGHHVAHALWVPEIRPGIRWCCYDDSSCTGRLPDPGSTVLAAATAHAGMVTFSSREAMQRQLAPGDPAAIARRAALLDAAVDTLPGTPDPARAAEPGRALVRAALARAEQEDPALTDDDVVGLSLALSLPDVRDACLASALPPGGSRAATAERLWLALVRATPPPERAQAACLLGYSAYVRGEGALAGMAFANALEADPGHVLAGLLNQALEHAVPPSTLTRLGRDCAGPRLWDPEPPG
ncbi:DUF4192 domain-containing protein [Qaidamihabitans albus]|uniref:DUF4192 domain-containing protein n=1 Tax=Qaidamihabitans albus TaxID=2795733 RepID=UPI0018F23E2E|nr:DUF4192 domain-containing protein [Qaidamihabitans albus]